MFWVSVPIGMIGTDLVLPSACARPATARPARIDWLGNVTFAVGLIALLAGITYGIQPYGGHTIGWTNPLVLGGLIGGAALLVAFCVIETAGRRTRCSDLRAVPDPRVRGRATWPRCSPSIARGGLQFMLIIWLQGIWLPLHGYAFERHPAVGGHLPAAADRRLPGRRAAFRLAVRPVRRPAVRHRRAPAVVAASFVGLLLLPVDFRYRLFAMLHAASTASAAGCSPRRTPPRS